MTSSWQNAKSPAPLSAAVIHVWRVSLAADEKQGAGFLAILSADERKRAAGFKFEVDRQRFVVAHGVLRLLLAAYLRELPERLVLVPDSRGKPRLAGPSGDSIRFNLSHSGDMALCAFAQGLEVGVDIEQIGREVDELDIARRMFAPNEVRQLETMQGDERTAAFFQSWTRLEAVAKASGRGLGGMPLGEGAAKGGSDDGAVWPIVSLQPGSGYAGAVAAEGTGWKIQCFDWSR
jgi:4'-phosphopantetheinyl transferase